MEVGKLHTLGGETVEVRSGDVLRSHSPDVGITEVIGENKDDVRLFDGGGGEGGGAKAGEK